ncbi:MarC family protein [Desulfobotulus sp.]|jgi:multiple antibiotic resistance protein|uniref:MarC family protein n=1 Tax=Desulfobotulus sp. TaxID=1940337 RepID=UPI002A36A72D|nr:MarC family protein [Desulfobotulus sp.]MDY0162005.1 MarC family protein [Desulfobotulus sp.]
MLQNFIHLYLKIFLLLTPFFVLSVFLSMTAGMGTAERRRIASKITIAVLVASFVLFFFGHYIFYIFGITIDAFRIGAGAILFLSAVTLIKGPAPGPALPANEGDFSVVPLAIPITVGPGTIGALLVMGTGYQSLLEKITACLSLTAAGLSVGALLWTAGGVERLIGRLGLSILTKLTGLFVASIAAQIIFTGIRNFLGPLP